MGNKKRNSNFILQGSILAVAGILVRVIGLLYRAPLTQIIDNIGNSYYSSAYEIYSMILLISSYSIPLALSKEMSTKIALGQYRNARKVFYGALFYAVIVGFIGMGGAWILAPTLGAGSDLALRVLSPTIFLSAILGVFRGYFQGHRTMLPTSISQILEQIANAAGSVGLAYLLTRPFVESGEQEKVYRYGAAGSAAGTEIGVLVALVFMLILFFLYQPREKKLLKRDVSGQEDSYADIMRIIILTITPVIFSTFIYNISGTIDLYFFKEINKIIGMKTNAIETFWGIYSGHYKVLINLPIALASAISTAMIPSITMAIARGERRDTKRRVDMAFHFTMIIAIPATFGLISLAEPILMLLFPGKYTDTSVKMLMYGSLTVLFYCISTISNSVLQGIGKLKIPVKHSAISLVLHIAVLAPMLYFLKLHVYAVIASTFVFTCSMCFLNALSLRKYLHYKMNFRKTFVKPILCSMIMAAGAFGVYHLMNLFIKSNAICLMIAVLIAVLIYFVSMLLLKGITKEELERFPKGNFILKIAYKFHLM